MLHYVNKYYYRARCDILSRRHAVLLSLRATPRRVRYIRNIPGKVTARAVYVTLLLPELRLETLKYVGLAQIVMKMMTTMMTMMTIRWRRKRIGVIRITRDQSNLTKSASRGPISRLGVTPGGRKLYH